MTPYTTLTIPIRNESPEDLKITLDSLLNQTIPPNQILICDASVAEPTISTLRKYEIENPLIKIIKQKGKGVGNARQTIYEHCISYSDIIITVDVGLKFYPTFVENHIEKHRAHPEVGVVSGHGMKIGGDLIHPEGGGLYFSQSHSSFKKEALLKVNGWERHFPREEDLDIRIRLKRAKILSLLSDDVEPESYFQSKDRKIAYESINRPNSPGFIKKYGLDYVNIQPNHIIRDIVVIALFISIIFFTPLGIIYHPVVMVIPLFIWYVIILSKVVLLPFNALKNLRIAFTLFELTKDLFGGYSVIKSVYKYFIVENNHEWNLAGYE